MRPVIGGLQPEQVVERAVEFDYSACAVNDYGTFLGSLKAATKAQNIGYCCFLSTRLVVNEIPGVEFVFFPLNCSGYGELCWLLSRSNIRNCVKLSWLSRLSAENVAVVIFFRAFSVVSGKVLRDALSGFKLKYIARLPFDDLVESKLADDFSEYSGIPRVATFNPGFVKKSELAVSDCLNAIKRRKTLLELEPNDRFSHFGKGNHSSFFVRMFRDKFLSKNFELFSSLPKNLLSEIRQNFPKFSENDHENLRQVCERKFKEKHLGLKERSLMEKELRIIRELGYERFFLLCHDLVEFARSRGILCQGRGAAANSVVCYLLGITNVHPSEIDFLFERFINRERNEPPDIDIDFESDRRQEIFDYIFKKYRGRCALVSSVITFQLKNSIRDVGRILNIPPEVLNKLASKISYWSPETCTADLLKKEAEVSESLAKAWLELASSLQDFPRHLSQHVGGVLFHGGKIWELGPVFLSNDRSRLMIELTKDDIDEMRFVKVDILGLGMLSAISETLRLLEQKGTKIDVSKITADDEKVFELLQSGRTVGVFQVESRAQQSMITKLKPKSFYDLVIEVAIVRPGPIVGDVVHPYLRRRQGIETVEFPDEKVRKILGKTLGVPLFQEQALRLAKELANFSDGELEQLRKALRSFRPSDKILSRFKDELGRRLREAGYSSEFTDLCVSQIKGFSQYGFPESHAASFAKIVYISAWLKTYFPAFFFAGLLNAQPAGFYNPRQLITDAKNFGVQVIGQDINHSYWESVADGNLLRLGFNLIKNLPKSDADQIVQERKHKRFSSFDDFLSRIRLSSKSIAAIVEAGCFDSIEENRKKLLFKLFAETEANFPIYFSESDEFFYDTITKNFATKYGYIERLKKALNVEALTYSELMKLKPRTGATVKVFGVASIKQRPPTAKGVCFICLEDDAGFINVIVYPDLFSKKSEILVSSELLIFTGVVQDYLADLIPYVRAVDVHSVELKALD